MTQETPERSPKACPECHTVGPHGRHDGRLRWCETADCRVVQYEEVDR